jgi:hypothetical protein
MKCTLFFCSKIAHNKKTTLYQTATNLQITKYGFGKHEVTSISSKQVVKMFGFPRKGKVSFKCRLLFGVEGRCSLQKTVQKIFSSQKSSAKTIMAMAAALFQ